MRRKIGAVLIEFAFAIPVFLVLIYYIHDLPKQKLMQRKMQFVANEMAAIIQNIAAQKSTPITQTDLKNATRLAFLSVFPGTTMYTTKTPGYYLPLGYMAHTWIYYLIGIGENKAEVKWYSSTWTGYNNFSSASRLEQHEASSLNYISGNASSIYPALKISKGEVKLIVEVALYYNPDRYFSDGTPTKNVPPRKAFKFLLLTPKVHGSTLKVNYFPGVTVFAPVSGFSETPPQ